MVLPDQFRLWVTSEEASAEPYAPATQHDLDHEPGYRDDADGLAQTECQLTEKCCAAYQNQRSLDRELQYGPDATTLTDSHRAMW